RVHGSPRSSPFGTERARDRGDQPGRRGRGSRGPRLRGWRVRQSFFPLGVTGDRRYIEALRCISHAFSGVNAVCRLKGIVMQYSRRQIGKLALSAIPAASVLPRAAWAADKPNSKVNGVVIGMNVPYNFGNQATSAEDILQRCVQLGVSGVELR